MTDLPASWTLCEIGDVLQPIEKTQKKEADRLISYVDISSIDNESNRITAPKRMSLAAAPSRARQKIRSGDVLFSTVRPYLRNIASVEQALDGEIASTGFAVLRGARGIDPRYLFYKSISHEFVSALTGEQYGVSYPAVKEDHVRQQPLELPPTAEQRRIVERVDVLFDEIDRGVESLRDARRSIGLYRQSLLKSAFEGRLTANWREANTDKLESPEVLLARIKGQRQDRYQATLQDWKQALGKWHQQGGKGTKPAKPKQPREIRAEPIDNGTPGWMTAPLGLVIVDPIYGTPKKCGYGTGATGVLRIPNIGSGRIDPSDLKTADFDEMELARFSLQEGDVLTVRSNGSLPIVGKPALVQQQHTDYLFAGYLIRLRSIAQSLVPKYLVYMLTEPKVRAQIETKAKSTSGVNNISAKELQELDVPICCLEEQAEIVRILDASLEAVEIVDADIQANLVRAEALRQSILKKAFAGQLVPQDPSDEPATILLQRIEADSASQHPQESTRKRKARIA